MITDCKREDRRQILLVGPCGYSTRKGESADGTRMSALSHAILVVANTGLGLQELTPQINSALPLIRDVYSPQYQFTLPFPLDACRILQGLASATHIICSLLPFDKVGQYQHFRPAQPPPFHSSNLPSHATNWKWQQNVQKWIGIHAEN